MPKADDRILQLEQEKEKLIRQIQILRAQVRDLSSKEPDAAANRRLIGVDLLSQSMQSEMALLDELRKKDALLLKLLSTSSSEEFAAEFKLLKEKILAQQQYEKMSVNELITSTITTDVSPEAYDRLCVMIRQLRDLAIFLHDQLEEQTADRAQSATAQTVEVNSPPSSATSTYAWIAKLSAKATIPYWAKTNTGAELQQFLPEVPLANVPALQTSFNERFVPSPPRSRPGPTATRPSSRFHQRPVELSAKTERPTTGTGTSATAKKTVPQRWR